MTVPTPSGAAVTITATYGPLADIWGDVILIERRSETAGTQRDRVIRVPLRLNNARGAHGDTSLDR